MSLLGLGCLAACAGRGALTSDGNFDLSNLTGGSTAGTGGTGGGSTTGGSIDGAALTYYRDMKPVIDARCANCHTPGAIGPFTLTSYADVSAHAADMQKEVSNGTMPPWQPDDVCNQYQGSIALSDDEKAALTAWLGAGAPPGDPSQTPVALPPETPYPALRADMTLTMAKPYSIQTSPDEYRCFILQWPATTTKYVQGFAMRPGNLAVVHHAIVDIVAPGDANSVMKQDGADGKPGWACGQSGASLNWLGAWAPGGRAGPFAADGSLGTRIDPGTLLVLQMHYHTENVATAAPDRTSIDLQLADSVPKVGHMVPMINVAWVVGSYFPGGNGMDIPANDPDAMATWTTDAAQLLGAGNAIYTVGVHAHVRATQGNLTLNRASGGNECLLNIPHYNFHWQNGYPLVAPPPVASGDKITLTCHWDNSAANQPLVNGVKAVPRDIRWGEGTNDEMCLGILYVAPK